MSAQAALRAALVKALRADADLIALTGGERVHDGVPRGPRTLSSNSAPSSRGRCCRARRRARSTRRKSWCIREKTRAARSPR